MKIIEVWREAKSFDGAFDVLLDVGGRVGYLMISEGVNSTLGSNYMCY